MRGNYLIKLHYKFGLPSGKRRQVKGRRRPLKKVKFRPSAPGIEGRKGKGGESR